MIDPVLCAVLCPGRGLVRCLEKHLLERGVWMSSPAKHAHPSSVCLVVSGGWIPVQYVCVPDQ